MIRGFLLAIIVLVVASDASAQGLLEFTQPGCGPCVRMRPLIARLRQRGFRIIEHDVTQNNPVTLSLGIQTTPTFVAVDAKGHEVARLVGARSEPELIALARRAGIVIGPNPAKPPTNRSKSS